MSAEHQGSRLLHPVERFLTIFGALACTVVTIVVWKNVSSYQGMWPLPALYFIEVAALSVLSAVLFLRGAAFARTFVWGTSGALGAFCLLGMFSVGALYLPIALIFAAAAIASDMHGKGQLAWHLMVCLLASLVQAALMLTLVNWLGTGVGF
jgi:hypothetical protein